MDLLEDQIHFLDWGVHEDTPPNPSGSEDRGQNRVGEAPVPGHVTISSPENDGERDRVNKLPEREEEQIRG